MACKLSALVSTGSLEDQVPLNLQQTVRATSCHKQLVMWFGSFFLMSWDSRVYSTSRAGHFLTRPLIRKIVIRGWKYREHPSHPEGVRVLYPLTIGV
jgi:hypothetical protein